MMRDEIEPAGTYRPQYHLRWRGMVRMFDRFPRFKEYLAGSARHLLRQIFEPGMVTTERVIEYPFVFEQLHGVTGPVLDLGCCHSRLPIALASRGFAVVGMDFNPYPYRHPGLKTVRADITQMPFGGSTFAAVLAVSVIEHIGIGHYGEPEAGRGDQAAVRELARILRPNGKAVITVPFGQAMTNHWMRVYDGARLRQLVAPLHIDRVEYAVSRQGLWMPGMEGEAGQIDWNGPDRAVALVAASKEV